MRFAKQKFLIGLCFLSLLPTSVLALLETPELSTWVMNLSLSIVRVRTGLKIDAKSWEVSLLTMSAKIEEVEIKHQNITFEAPKVQVWVSPLSLILGKLQLNDFEVSGAKVYLDDENVFAKSFFSLNDSSDLKADPSKKSFLDTGELGVKIPQLLGEAAENIIERLKSRNISFEEIKIRDLNLHWGKLRGESLNLALSNLNEGQLRLEWDFKGLFIERGLARVDRWGGTISLLSQLGSNYQIFIGDLTFVLNEPRKEGLKIRGAWPGDLDLDLQLDIEGINQWIMNSPWLDKNKFEQPTHGKLLLSSTLMMKSDRVEKANVSLSTHDFSFEGFHVNRMSLNANVDFLSKDKYQLQHLNIKLPYVEGVDRAWSNEITLGDYSIVEDKLSAKVMFQEASVCGIIKAAGEKECQVGLAITGGLDLEGSLKPFEFKVMMDVGVSAGPIMTDPYVSGDTSRVVDIKPSQLRVEAQVFEKNLIFNSVKAQWGEKNEMNAKGNLVYVPTKLNLSVTSKALNLHETIDNIVDLRFGGLFDVDASILYDHSLERTDRTVVRTQLKASEFVFEDQNFGSIAGPLSYDSRILRLGPFQLRSGGGSADVRGSLTPDPDRGPYFNLFADLQRFEFVSYLDREKTSEVFRGFVSGRANLQGYIDTKKSNTLGLLGDINLRARNFSAFKIPFNEADLRAAYKQNDLIINDMTARKDGGVLKLSGLLSPKGGSELIFKSDSIPIQNIDIEPKLALFEKGNVKIDGYWRPAEGWGLQGEVKDAVIAGAELGAADVDLKGDEKSLNIDVEFSEWLNFAYRGVYREKSIDIDRLEVKLKDQGIYAGLAYLGDWTQEKPVTTKGEMSFEWSPRSGYFKSNNLQILAPHQDRVRREEVLNASGSQELFWENSKFQSGELIWEGVSQLKTVAAPGDTNIQIESNLALGLVRLFVPALDMRAGRVNLEGRIPLSPHFSTLSASGKITNGILMVPGVASEFENLNLDFDVQRSQVRMKRGSMKAGQGQVVLQGVYLLDFDKPALDMNLVMESARVVILDDLLTQLEGSVNIRGEKMPYLMSGRLAVSEGLYTKEFESTTEVSLTNIEEALKFDLDLEILESSQIRNSIIDANMLGRINVKGGSNEPLLVGDLDFPKGVIRANNIEFTVVQGQVKFYGNRDGVPIVNMRAQTVIRYAGTDYKIEMNARGPGTSLNIEFSSEPTLSNQDIVSLLAFGVIRQDDLSSEEGDDLVLAAQAEAFQAIFGRAIGNSLSKSTGFDIRLKPSSSGTGSTETIPKVSVMRRLSDRVTARFARSLDVSNPEKDLQVDYRLLNNVNLSGIWENPKPEESSLGVDLRFRFDVK